MNAVDINIATLNVRGLNNKNKRNVIYSWLKNKSYDICFLQETFCTLRNSDNFSTGWRGKIFHSCTDSAHSRGVAILINKNLDCDIVSSKSDNGGRIVLVNVVINNIGYTLVNVYAPNTAAERVTFFCQLRQFVNMHAINKSRLIIGGDFNCVLNSNDRLSGVTDRSTHALTEVLEHFNIIDAWKYFNPENVEFTYIDPSPNMHNSRIDLLLCSKALKSVCSCCSICQSPAPDHKVVTFKIKVVKNERGKRILETEL